MRAPRHLADQGIPGPANRDPDSRFPAKSGIGRFPLEFPAESGIGDSLPDSRQKIGNRGRFGGSDSRLPSESEHHSSGLGIYSAASIMPVLSQAACGSYSGSKDGACMLLRRVTSITAVDSEYTQLRVPCQCSHRQHAAPIQGPREGTCSCHLPPATRPVASISVRRHWTV
jgi:hypothetical protein